MAAAAKATAFKRNFMSVSSLTLPWVSCNAGREGMACVDLPSVIHPSFMTSASNAIETTKLIQIDGSCARPNQSIIFSLTATKARFR